MFVMLSVRTSTVCERPAETEGKGTKTTATTTTSTTTTATATTTTTTSPTKKQIIADATTTTTITTTPTTTDILQHHLDSIYNHNNNNNNNNIEKSFTKSISFDKNINKSNLLLTELNNFKHPPALQVSNQFYSTVRLSFFL